jgi:hypothetical protein
MHKIQNFCGIFKKKPHRARQNRFGARKNKILTKESQYF